MRKRGISLLLALVLAAGMVFGCVPRASAASQQDLETAVEQQLMAYVASLGTPDAEKAASELMNFAITGRGRYQKMDESDPVTVALANTNLYQIALKKILPEAIRYAQTNGVDTLYTGGEMSWYTISRRYSCTVYGDAECTSESRVTSLVSENTKNGAHIPINTCDQSMIDVVGSSRCRITLVRTGVTTESVTYLVNMKLYDDFDFNADYSKSKNVEAALISKFGMLLSLGLIDTYSWEVNMEFEITVPNLCIHETTDYRWEFDGIEVTSTGTADTTDNPLTRIQTKKLDGTYYRPYYATEKTSRLNNDLPWVVELRVADGGNVILSATKSFRDGDPFLLKGTSYVHGGYAEAYKEYDPEQEKEVTKYTRHLYGVKYTPLGYKYKDWHTFRLENRIAEDGSNMVYLLIDGNEIGPMVDYYVSGVGDQGTQDDWFNGVDFKINYIGSSNFKLQENLDMEYIQIWENGENAEPYSYFKTSIVEPTCTEPGKTVHTCSLCGASYYEVTAEPLGHVEEVVPGKAATCEGEGLTDGTKCTVCGEVVKVQEGIPALGHSWDAGTVTKEATCTEVGEMTYVCTNDASHTKTEVIEMLPHKLVEHKAVAPRCTTAGVTAGTSCAVCWTVLEKQELVPATGHSWGEGVVTLEPSPEGPGVVRYTCTICGEHKEDEIPYEVPIRIAGENRFETAFQVADAMKENLGIEKFDAVIVASGTNFADALSGSYLAAVKNAPILLSFNDSVNESLKEYIKENLNAGGTVYILGGESAVPRTMEEGLDSFVIKRLAGNDRFGTNLAILNEAGVEEKDILVCTGLDFADSLSASASERPILLVWDELTEAQKIFLDSARTEGIYIIGGENAVSSELELQLSLYGDTARIGGSNRFETSVLIAETFFEKPDSAVLAYAWNYPDGLCGGALASTMDAPLILTMTGYESQAGEYVQSHGLSQGTILGGVGLISDDSVCAIYAIHILRDMAMVYHNATNFGYQKVEYTQEDLEDWYEVIWAGWRN